MQTGSPERAQLRNDGPQEGKDLGYRGTTAEAAVPAQVRRDLLQVERAGAHFSQLHRSALCPAPTASTSLYSEHCDGEGTATCSSGEQCDDDRCRAVFRDHSW